MLTSVGRAAIRRLAASANATTTSSLRFSSRVRVTARGPLQLNPSHPSLNLARGLAAVRTATKSTTTTAKKPAKTTTTKGTAVKAKTTTKAKAKAKTTTKPKAARPKKVKAKKVKAKPKPKAKPKKKKPLTEQQRAVLQKKELRKTALFSEPKHVAFSPWQLFVAQETKAAKPKSAEELRGGMRKVADAYKTLPASEIQKLEQVGAQNKLNYQAAYKAWVETHTPAQIANANKARNFLKKKYNVPKGTLRLISDDRIPKRPLTAYSLFTKARWATGDVPPGGIRGATASIAGEWKTLSETEKKPYLDLALSETERYEKDVFSILGRKAKTQRSASL